MTLLFASMRKGLLTLCLALACTGLAGVPSVKIVGVYPPDGVRDARNIDDRQYILTGGKVPALVAREQSTGKTIWKTFIGGRPVFVDKALNDGILFVKDQVRSGDFFFMNEEATLLNSAGSVIFEGFSSYIAQANQKVLISAEQDVFYADYLVSDFQVDYWIVDIATKDIDKGGFKILRRPSCEFEYWMRDSFDSIFIVGHNLIFSLKDSCGYYHVSYNWTMGSASRPEILKGVFDNKDPISF